jgi:hypothetical protein
VSSSCGARKASSRSRSRGFVAPGHLRPHTPRTPPQESPAEPAMPAMPGNPNLLPESLRAIEPPQRPVNRDDSQYLSQRPHQRALETVAIRQRFRASMTGICRCIRWIQVKRSFPGGHRYAPSRCIHCRLAGTGSGITRSRGYSLPFSSTHSHGWCTSRSSHDPSHRVPTAPSWRESNSFCHSPGRRNEHRIFILPSRR